MDINVAVKLPKMISNNWVSWKNLGEYIISYVRDSLPARSNIVRVFTPFFSLIVNVDSLSFKAM